MDEQSRNSFPTDPQGRARLWTKEFKAARTWLRDWQKTGDEVVDRFLDEQTRQGEETHLNYFWANTVTMMAMLYGKMPPRTSVSRRHADPNDDLARVGAEMLERILNSNVERYDDSYQDALWYTLVDFLLPGFGNSKVRYKCEFRDTTQPAQGAPGTPRYAPEVKRREKVPGSEDACVDYFYWADQLWSPCRTHGDKRWHAYKTPMTKDELHARFDSVLEPAVVDSISLGGRLFGAEDRATDDKDEDPWARADVWEVWDKQRHEVVWFVEGFDRVLDVKPDTLQLPGFWPSPRPLMANLTTRKCLPRPDYVLAQDIYASINLLATRVSELEDALRVAGAYDATNKGLERLLDENVRNQLIPVTGFAAIAEKGGMEGAIAWLPVQQVAEVLDRTRTQLVDKQRQLYEITGWSDVMRGAMQDPQQLATNTRAEIRFGSVRVQRVQDEFSRYASELQRLRAELIVRLFDDQTIIERSNIMQTADAELVGPALKRLRQEVSRYAIEVKPEALALADFAALKAERTEFLGAISQFMTSTSQLLPALGPQGGAVIAPALGEMVKWALAGFKGGSSIEGVWDKVTRQMADLAQQAAVNPQPQQPDPRAAVQQMKAQNDMARDANKVQTEAQLQQIKTSAEAERQRIQTEANVEEKQREADVQEQVRRQKFQAEKQRGRRGGTQ